MIACDRDDDVFEYFALALNSDYVVEIIYGSDSTRYIQKINWEQIPWKYCEIVTQTMDDAMINSWFSPGKKPRPLAKILAAATNDLGKMDISGCDREQWVNTWRYGVGFNSRTRQTAGCKAKSVKNDSNSFA